MILGMLTNILGIRYDSMILGICKHTIFNGYLRHDSMLLDLLTYLLGILGISA